MLKRTLAAVAATIMLVLVVVPLAAADDPNNTQYGNASTALPNEMTPPKAPSSNEVSPGSFTPPVVAQDDTLPFTGVDLGVALAIGFATVAGGLALRRVARSEG